MHPAKGGPPISPVNNLRLNTPRLEPVTHVVAERGDLTTYDVDVVVNAANSELLAGGGVDGAIHRAGGPEIATEARAIAESDGRLETGHAVITTAGNLPARHVIHTVGPIWGRHSEEKAVRLLADCYRNSLDLAAERRCRTIAFPNISTGVYCFPKRLAASTAVGAVQGWVESRPDAMDRIVFVCFDDENLTFYEELTKPSG